MNQNSKLLFSYLVFFGFMLTIVSCKSQKVVSSTKNENTANVGTSVEVAKNERGVLFRRFGGGVDTSKTYLPGKYDISPFDRFIIYNIESKKEIDAIQVVSKDEINIELNIEYTFKPIPEKIALLHRYIGSNYPESVVNTEIRKTIKAYFKNYKGANISLNKKEQFEMQLLSIAKKEIVKKYVYLESIQITKINLQ